MTIGVTSDLIKGAVTIPADATTLVISVVAYQHPVGVPARFLAGMVPAIDLARKAAAQGVSATIRVIDPSPIAEHCNGWRVEKPIVWDLIKDFLTQHGVEFSFDRAAPVTDETQALLKRVGAQLQSPDDPAVADMIGRITASGKVHGGQDGERNALLYAAAHPFSWLEFSSPLLWDCKPVSGCHYINLISNAEARYTLIRQYLRRCMPEMHSGIEPADHEMAVCSTPCYMLVGGEPTLEDLNQFGVDACRKRYFGARTADQNHKRAFRDFEVLMQYLPVPA